MLGAMRNWGRWSETVAVRFPETVDEEIEFENILSIKVLELGLILVGVIMCGRKKWDERESRYSLVALSRSYFNRSTLKSPRRYTVLFSFESLSSNKLR